jgi:hypothetical protein
MEVLAQKLWVLQQVPQRLAEQKLLAVAFPQRSLVGPAFGRFRQLDM